MKRLPSVLLAALLLLPATAAFARYERTTEKSFSVQPGGTLTVSTAGGDITVEPGKGEVVRVVARQVFPRADDAAEADEIARDLELVIEQEGNDVSARAKYTKRGAGRLFGSWPPVSVSFTVTVPERYHVDLSTSGGNVVVGDLTGKTKARTSGGNLRLGRLQGPVDGSTSGGDIHLAEAVERVRLSTSGGSIRVRRAAGDVALETSGGDIEIDEVSGAVTASTSGGNVRAGLTGPLKSDVSLSTSGGEVEARVSRDASFRLDARTSGGDVEAEGLTIKIENGGSGRSRLSGEVNGGGPTLKLRSSGGDVTVRVR